MLAIEVTAERQALMLFAPLTKIAIVASRLRRPILRRAKTVPDVPLNQASRPLHLKILRVAEV